MHLLAISLLTILAGTLLLAKFRKEMSGKFFAFISWFFIVAGFILFYWIYCRRHLQDDTSWFSWSTQLPA